MNKDEITGINFTGDIHIAGDMFNIHDNQNVNISMNGEPVKLSEKKRVEVPERLTTADAEELMADLVDAGILHNNWQPNGLSGTERALVAKAVCDRLEIKEVWQVFGRLWNEKPETLRSYLNKALEQKKSLEFQDKLQKILR